MVVAILVLVFLVIIPIIFPDIRGLHPYVGKGIDTAFPFIYAAIGLGVLYLGVKTMRSILFPQKQQEEEDDEEEDDDAAQNLPDHERIARFFLRLYKAQLGAEKDAAAQVLRVDSDAKGKTITYELRVKMDQDWQARRMRISPLGEGSGSKSKCFYAIYDDHMVVKIPPKPITDFDQYVEAINKEIRIKEQVAPRECIVPRVSVILKKIYSFDDEKFISPAQLEDKYTKWLRGSKFQRYLKISGAFAFFMDLSRYFFLGNIVEDMHNMDERLDKEIAGHGEVVFELQDFVGRYGEKYQEAGEAVYSLVHGTARKVYDAFSAKGKPPPSDFEVRRWILTQMRGEKLKKGVSGLPDDMAAEVSRVIEESLSQGAGPLEEYREALRSYLRGRSFGQNKARMESISANLTEVLAWLAEKKVSIRDLKPDNLLVAGDPKEYPGFLADANAFRIGLIDVETAVIFKPGPNGKIPQPMLGGTPYFATPSHLMENSILEKLYPSLPRTLHMQDWQATVGMIYRVVTGAHLFVKTGRTLPAVGKTLHQAAAEGKDLVDVARDVTRKFFAAAEREFAAKMRRNGDILKQVNISLPENARAMLQSELSETERDTMVAIETFVNGQKVFSGEKNKRVLLSASADALRGQREKLEKANAGAAAIQVLKDLEGLKAKKGREEEILARLADPSATITAFELLHTMFGVVQSALCPSDWGELASISRFN
ncbi:MAG: hypothetical protein JRI97_08485 [Deltaproteobacteria bacterium]|nr:hypothetical protein [Deltaproteobacteria bacterium]